MLQEYVNGLGSGREMPILFEPFLFYFRNEEKQFGADLLMVKNRLDYIEILSDIADLARSQAPDSDPETFRIVADSIVGSIAWRQEFVEIARKYSAIAEITPIATRAREESRRPTVEARRRARQIAKPRNAEEIAKALKADEIADAWRKADEIGIVGGSLRDRYGITPSPTREERQEFDRYRKRIADRNGDVYQALWELRADEAKRPARPRRVARIKARQPAKTRPAEPSPVAESPRGSATPPLSPRSRSTLDAIIDDLAAGPITETISEEEI
jgi:hypothetical protein